MLLTERFDARRAAELITREQAEIAVLVPTMLYRLVGTPPPNAVRPHPILNH